MSQYGTIRSYDSGRGAGIIAPDAGGAHIVFARCDQQWDGQEPRVHQCYRFETLRPQDGGMVRAVNLQQQQTHREQAAAQRG